MTKESFTGKVKWAQNIRDADDFRGQQRWKISQILEGEELKRFKDLNFRIKIRDDEDGVMVVWSRPVSKDFGKQIVEFLPPVVEWDNGEEFEGLIGNGTIARVESSVFPLDDGSKAHRLEKIVILDLVEYDGGGMDADDPGIARVIDKVSGNDADHDKPAF